MGTRGCLWQADFLGLLAGSIGTPLLDAHAISCFSHPQSTGIEQFLVVTLGVLLDVAVQQLVIVGDHDSNQALIMRACSSWSHIQQNTGIYYEYSGPGLGKHLPSLLWPLSLCSLICL